MGEKKEYIERGAFLDMIAGNTLDTWGKGLDRAWWSHAVLVKDNFVRMLKDAPAADVVEVRHSQWDEDKYPFCNVCPECGLIIDRTCIKWNSGKLNLCTNCGARMDSERKEQT